MSSAGYDHGVFPPFIRAQDERNRELFDELTAPSPLPAASTPPGTGDAGTAQPQASGQGLGRDPLLALQLFPDEAEELLRVFEYRAAKSADAAGRLDEQVFEQLGKDAGLRPRLQGSAGAAMGGRCSPR
jgi:hypothetical protein